MPRRARPTDATRSEKWLRVAVNDRTAEFSKRVAATFGWRGDDPIEWLSPLARDGNAEYFDQAFLDRLGVGSLRVPLTRFWPAGGPRWDGLGRTRSGKLILVEAKAYVEEAVDYRTDAKGASLTRRPASASPLRSQSAPSRQARSRTGRCRSISTRIGSRTCTS
jgi:hypothetical protein